MAESPFKSPAGPDLRKLPLQQRKSLTNPIPLRPGEVYGRVMITSEKHGLHHPNGRISLTVQREDGATESRFNNKVRIDMSDQSARIPLVTVLLDKEPLETVIKSAVVAYLQLGGSLKDLKLEVDKPVLPPLMENPLFRAMAAEQEDDSNND